jgi:hypothetical protein
MGVTPVGRNFLLDLENGIIVRVSRIFATQSAANLYLLPLPEFRWKFMD